MRLFSGARLGAFLALALVSMVAPATVNADTAEARQGVSKLDALKSLNLGSFVAHRDFYTAKLGSRNRVLTIFSTSAGGHKRWNAVLLPDRSFSFKDMFSEARNSILGNAKIENAVIVVAASDHTITVGHFPAAAQARLKKFTNNRTNVSVTLKAGVNALAYLDIAGSGQAVKTLHTTLGGPKKVLLNGHFGGTAIKNFADGQSHAAGADLKDLLLTAKFPSFNPAGYRHVSIGDDKNKMVLTFKADKPGTGIEATATAPISIKIGTVHHSIDKVQISFNPAARKKGATFVSISGSFKSPFPSVVPFPELALTSLAIIGGVFKDGDKKKLWLGVSSGATLNGTKMAFWAGIPSGKKSSDDYVVHLQGKLKVSDLVKHFTLGNFKNAAISKVEISPGAVSATATVDRKSVRLGMFEAGNPKNWHLAIGYADIALSDLLPLTGQTVFKHLTMDHAALVISEHGLDPQPLSDLPAQVRPIFTAVTGSADTRLAMADGITLVASVDPTKAGMLKSSLGDLGAKTRKFLFAGTIGGVFSGTKSLDIRADMPEFSLAGLPRFAKLPSGKLTPKLFARYDSAGAKIGASLRATLGITAKGTKHDFDTALAMDVGTAGVSIDVTGTMDEDWTGPFGIKGLTLKGPERINGKAVPGTSIAFNVAETGGVTVTFAGRAKAGAKNIDVTASVTADGGVIDAAAFEGSINEIGLADIAAVAKEAIKAASDKTIDMSALPTAATMKSVDVAFASPGSNATSVGLHGAGIRFKGDLWMFDKKLGTLNTDVDDTGFNLSGSVTGFSQIGPLSLRNPTVAAGGGTAVAPYLKLGGGITLLGSTSTVDIDIGADHMTFDMTDDFSGAWSTKIIATSSAVSRTSPNFSVSGAFQGDFEIWLMNQIKSKLGPLNLTTTTTVDRSFARAVTAATTNLDRARAVATNRQAKVLKAERKVGEAANALKSRYQNCEKWVAHYKKKRDGESWLHPLRKAEYEADMLVQEVECVALKVAWDTAQASAHSFDEHAKVFLSVDLQPDVIEARAALAAAKADQASATAVVGAVNAVKSDLSSLVNSLVAGVGKSTFQVEQASFSNVAFSDLTAKTPATVTLKVSVNGIDYTDTVSFSLGGEASAIEDAFGAFALKLATELLHDAKKNHPAKNYLPHHAKKKAVVGVKPWSATNIQFKNQHGYGHNGSTCMGVGRAGRKEVVNYASCWNGRFTKNAWDILKDGRIRSHGSNYCITYDDRYILLTCNNHQNQIFPVFLSVPKDPPDPHDNAGSYFFIAGGDGATYSPRKKDRNYFNAAPNQPCFDISTHQFDAEMIGDDACKGWGQFAWYFLPAPRTVPVPAAATAVTTPSPQGPLTSLSLAAAPPTGTAADTSSSPPAQ